MYINRSYNSSNLIKFENSIESDSKIIFNDLQVWTKIHVGIGDFDDSYLNVVLNTLLIQVTVLSWSI